MLSLCTPNSKIGLFGSQFFIFNVFLDSKIVNILLFSGADWIDYWHTFVPGFKVN